MALSDVAIRKAKPCAKPAKMADGGGLYLLLRPDGAKWWRLDYRRPITGKRNTLSLGTYPDTGLGDARAQRDAARKQIAAGIDPGENRKAEKAAGLERAANSFEVLAREWLAVRKPGWTDKNFEKEQGRLENHAFPFIGGRPVASLGVADIRPLIERLSKAGHLEQAHRLRFQLSRVFKFAVATARAERDPAADLSEALPSRRDMVKQRYPTITDPKRVGDLLRAIDGFGGTFPVACALKLAPLWFCRPGEIRMAEWAQFDLDGENPAYRVPPAIRKLRKREKEDPDTSPHVIPLSTQAIAVLRELHLLTGRDRYLFPGARDQKRHMSDGAINAALARIGFKDEMVGHGFRHMASTRLRESGWPRGPSDTALFADLLQDMTADQWRRLRPLIEHSTGWSRFALLTHEGDVVLFNSQDWEEEGGAIYSNDTYLPEPGVAGGASLYGQDPFRWESDLTLTRLMADGTVYRDEDLERDVLQEWMACYGEPPKDAWAWAVLDELTNDYIEEESHELEHLHAA